MMSRLPTPPAPMMGSRLLGFGLVAVSLGFTSLLVFVNAVAGLFR